MPVLLCLNSDSIVKEPLLRTRAKKTKSVRSFLPLPTPSGHRPPELYHILRACPIFNAVRLGVPGYIVTPLRLRLG
jgi:hypothetical protein